MAVSVTGPTATLGGPVMPGMLRKCYFESMVPNVWRTVWSSPALTLTWIGMRGQHIE